MMQWTRPLEITLELMVALWFYDILSNPLKEKKRAQASVSQSGSSCRLVNPSFV